MKILGIVCLWAALPALAPAEDWKALFDQLTSTDETVAAEARSRSFQTIIPRLESLDADALNQEVTALLPLLDDSRPAVRLQVSGLIAGLALRRSDGTQSLRAATPVWLAQFSDSQPRVRENALRSVALLRPNPPAESFSKLKDLLEDNDSRIAGGATTGLMRLAPSVPEAEQAILEKLASEKRPDRLLPIVFGIGESGQANEKTVNAVAGYLSYGDDRVAMASAFTLQRLGMKAAGALPALERTVADSGLSTERKDAARRAIQAVSKK